MTFPVRDIVDVLVGGVLGVLCGWFAKKKSGQ